MEKFLEFVFALGALAPVVAVAAPAIGALIDGLKKVGVVKDGDAPKWSGVLNLAAFVAFFFLNDEQAKMAGGVLGGFATLAPYLFAFVVALIGTPFVREFLFAAGFGYSHSEE